MKWLNYCSVDFREPVERTLTSLGHVILPVDSPDGLHWDASRSLHRGEFPDAVVTDFNVGKLMYLHAGYWRGLGFPVVYLARSGVVKPNHLVRLAKVLGMFIVSGVDDLREVLEEGHPYFWGCNRET